MKNASRFFGILAIAAVIVLAFAACGSDGSDDKRVTDAPPTDGQLTITGFTGDYDDWYAIALRPSGSPMLIAAEDVNEAELILYGGKITGGKVTLKVWEGTDTYTLAGYSGNHTCDFRVLIFSKDEIYLIMSGGNIDGISPSLYFTGDVYGVVFIGGKGTKNIVLN